MNDVSGWAFNRHNQPVLANDISITKNSDAPFYCHCGEKHPVRLSRPSGAPDKRPFEPYFAHVASGYKRFRVCGGGCGGESEEHSLAKMLLQKRRGLYFFHTHKCMDCNARKTQRLLADEEGEMRLEHRDTSTGRVYDCCWVVDGQPKAILEVYHTHACTAEKLEAIRATGAVVLAEFDSREIIKALHATPIGPVELFNRLEDKEWRCSVCGVKAAADALARERVMKHVIPFGYHKGRTVEDLCKGGRRYLAWVAGYNVSTQNRRDDTVRQSDAWKRVHSRYIETVQAARTALEGCCWLCDENVDAPWKTICKSCFKKEIRRRRAGCSPTPYGDYVAGIP